MTNAQVTLLGRFEVSVDGRIVEIKSSKERALLARLALEPGTVVAADNLIEAIWPEGDRPDDPARALRYHVWHLRDLLEPDRADRSEGTLVLNRPTGYLLEIDPDAVDAVRVEADWDRSRDAGGDLRRRRDTLSLLLDAWRPACFADSSTHGPLAESAVRLDRLRATILGDRIVTDLALGRDADLVPELEQLVAANPFDERLRGQLMVALYRAGRQADALAVYAATRALLVDELGVEPGPDLRDLEHRILNQDADLGSAVRPSAVTAPLVQEDVQTNLPYPVDSFVGRDAELAEVHQLLGAHRLVTLTGAGGTGKTRLAIEACRSLVGEHADGVWLAELAPVADDAVVPTVVAEVWGLSATDSSVEDKVIAFLRHRRLLLLLDNCEHVHEVACRFVARVLRETPEVQILATSRESLGIAGETVVPVPSLARRGSAGAPGAAIALFIDRGRAARPTWTPGTNDEDAIHRICERVDGIPLGLELAAARLRSMDPSEIADHLDHSLGLLAVAAKHALPRHRTLAATVEWSYRLLSEPEQVMFRRASVFVGGFDLAAAHAVGSDPGAGALDVVDLVDSLVDKSLVIATPGVDGTRYRLLEPLRQWAQEQLVLAGDLDSVRLAHAHHFARLVADLSPAYHRRGQEVALRRTLVDYPNIRLALATLADVGDVDHHHLAMTFGLFSFWAHQSMHLEGFETCRRSLDLAIESPDLTGQVKTAFVGSVCGAWTGRAEAIDFAMRGRALAEQLGDPRAIAWAELALAIVHGNDGPPRGASVAVADPVTAGHMQRAVELWAAHSEPAWWDPLWERGLQQLCSSIFLPYDPDRLTEFRASKAAFEALGDLGWLAILYAQSLDLLEFAGPEVTGDLLDKGVDIAISPSWSNASRYRRGVLHQLLGDHHRAVDDLEAVIEYWQNLSDPFCTDEQRYLAISKCELGHPDEASRLLESVFTTIESGWGGREVLRTLVVAAHVLEAAGERHLAARAIGRAEPFQDNFVDTIGNVRTRLTKNLGAQLTESVMAEGAASDLSEVVTEVRAAIAALAVAAPPS
jgi:predicted ATPase/DNA-binding SARP family transcriptional activator